MKKYGIIAIVLLLIATSGIGAAHQTINKLKDDVTVTETVLTGDKSAAEGITVTTKTRYAAMPLYWETNYTTGDDTSLTCAFQYKDNKKADREFTVPGEYSTDIYFEIGPDDYEWWEDGNGEEAGYFPEEAVQAVIEKTSPGTTHKETVMLNDYMQNYRVQLLGSFIDENGFLISISDDEQAAQYFTMPIIKKNIWTVQVQKNQSGTPISVDIEPVTPITIYNASTMDDQAIYLFLTDMTAYSKETEENWQVSLPKNMCGLHRIPYQKDSQHSGRDYILDFSQAKLVCQMEQGAKVFQPEFSDDEKELRFFMQKDKEVSFVIMNKETFTIKQKIHLPYQGNDFLPDGFTLIENEEQNQMLMVFDDNRFCLLTKNKAGDYQLVLTDKLLQINPHDYFARGDDIAWSYDGNRLVFACLTAKTKDSGTIGSSYQLSVYENKQLIYAGFFENSLDYVGDFIEDGPTSESIIDDPITLSVPSAP